MGFQSRENTHFGTTNLEVPGQNDIWMQAPWLGIENTIRGKVVASPRSRPWWVLWIYVYSWFVRAPKVFQLCINQLVIWFVQVHVNNWPTCHSFLSPFRSSSTPLYPRSASNQGMYPNSISFRYFHLELAVESIKELRGVSSLQALLLKSWI
jgi:hypothetical protein